MAFSRLLLSEKSSIADVQLGSKYASAVASPLPKQLHNPILDGFFSILKSLNGNF